MFELTTYNYDLLDDLQPLQSKARDNVIAEIDEGQTMSPHEWYMMADREGCNAIFTIEIAAYYIKNGEDIAETIDILNTIAQRYYKTTLPVQAVWTGQPDNDFGYAVESAALTNMCMPNREYYDHLESTMIFKIPVNIKTAGIGWWHIVNGFNMWNNEKFYQDVYRIVSNFMNFSATLYSAVKPNPCASLCLSYPKKMSHNALPYAMVAPTKPQAKPMIQLRL